MSKLVTIACAILAVFVVGCASEQAAQDQGMSYNYKVGNFKF